MIRRHTVSRCASVLLGLAVILTLSGWRLGGGKDPELPEGSDRVDEFMVRHNLHPASVKLGRGAANLFTGWMELPINLEKRYSQTDPATSIGTGFAMGTLKSIARTAVGFYEMITFFVPYPEEFRPILPPLDIFKKHEDEQ